MTTPNEQNWKPFAINTDMSSLDEKLIQASDNSQRTSADQDVRTIIPNLLAKAAEPGSEEAATQIQLLLEAKQREINGLRVLITTLEKEKNEALALLETATAPVKPSSTMAQIRAAVTKRNRPVTGED